LSVCPPARPRPRPPPQALAAAEAAAAADAERAAGDAARRLTTRAAAAAALPPEPPASEPHAACLFRLPDGARLSRRFSPSDPVGALFSFVDSEGAGGLWPGEYRLVASYPRRAIEPPSGAAGAAQQTLEAAGLAAGAQAVLLLEPLGG
jgi:hypothetical protein